jgi:4-azaleucine resistance transporter AzlC
MSEQHERSGTHSVVRDALAISLAVGAFGVSFGVLARAAGLSIAQTQAMSLIVFTGASQFAAVAVVASGGSLVAAVGSGLLLGVRNTVYGIPMAPVVGGSILRRALSAQWIVDETTAMALAQETGAARRSAFWITAVAEFTLWNVGTLAGALAGERIGDPERWGLDAAFPAAFVALVAARSHSRTTWTVALIGGMLAVVSVPFVPAGAPVLVSLFALATLPVARAMWRRP